jgi:hypothetical protein
VGCRRQVLYKIASHLQKNHLDIIFTVVFEYDRPTPVSKWSCDVANLVLDFEEAIAAVKQEGIKVPLVVFGHMHQRLQCGHPLKRTMLVVRDKTIYLNAAVVPRVRGIMDSGLTTLTQRHFVLVELHNSDIEGIYEVWVTVGEEDCEVKLTLMYSRPGTTPMEVTGCRRSLM